MKNPLSQKTALILLAVVFVILIGSLMLRRNSPTSENTIPAITAVSNNETEEEVRPETKRPAEYIEVTDGCGPYFGGGCVNVRSGPGVEFPSVAKLRTSQVLRVTDTVTKDGTTWYKIGFDEWLRYADRVTGDWYVSADYVRHFTDVGIQDLGEDKPQATSKRIVIDRSEQMLYAYDGKALFMKEAISTGLDDTPTPRGQFNIYRKTPTRYMQGPIPDISDQYYDLPGVPWNLYFTYQGGAIHGAYWHDEFGAQHSHGCVNLPPEKAKALYEWADLGTPVLVQD